MGFGQLRGPCRRPAWGCVRAQALWGMARLLVVRAEAPRSLTALSIPRVSSMTKKTAAQAEDSGSVASASG